MFYKVTQGQYLGKIRDTSIIVASLFKTLCIIILWKIWQKHFGILFTRTQHWNLTKHGV